jgi:hypothetical protein
MRMLRPAKASTCNRLFEQSKCVARQEALTERSGQNCEPWIGLRRQSPFRFVGDRPPSLSWRGRNCLQQQMQRA